MKCRVCRGKASIEIRRHNAAFCRDHFVDHMHRQVERAIHDFKMIATGERLLLGVSGGKDSLALWDILTNLGYEVDGVYLGLGIDEYSDEGRRYSEEFARRRGLNLEVVDLATEVGFTIPGAATEMRRVPCSVCGLSKRYLLNDAARRGGYDVLVMGHNLDDEAAMLFGNVMQWNAEYLGRQRPVLPATDDGLIKKIKPLIRVGERETAAYAVLTGIEYEIDECPMASGNRANRIKEYLNIIEDRSPGTKSQFLFGFLDRAAHRFDEDAGKAELGECADCGQPTTAEVCAFCRLRARMAAE